MCLYVCHDSHVLKVSRLAEICQGFNHSSVFFLIQREKHLHIISSKQLTRKKIILGYRIFLEYELKYAKTLGHHETFFSIKFHR